MSSRAGGDLARSASDPSRARRLALAWLALSIASCADPPPAPPPEAPPPPPAACTLDAPTVHAGRAPTLAAGALALRTSAGPQLVPLGDELRPITLDAEQVVGLAARGQGWIALAETTDGPALLVIEGNGTRRLGLGSGTLVSGAVAVRGDRAFAAWTDGSRTLRVASIDLLRDRPGEPVAIETIDGVPLAAAAPTGAVVTWTARGASLLTIGDEATIRTSAPGLPLALLPAPSGVAVLHTAPDRTGLWLSAPGAPSVRVTPPDAQPESPAAAPLPDGALVAYRSGPDLFVQRLTPDGAPRGNPITVGGALGDAPRRRAVLATDADRFWVAWEAGTEEAPEIHVRAGRCP